MKKIIAALAFAGLATGLIILVSAWGGESTATAKQNFCNSLHDFSSTVTSYQGLKLGTASNEEIDQAYDDIATAWDDVVNEAEDWTYADDNHLVEAYDDLYYAMQDLPGDYTISEDIEALQPELDALADAYHDTINNSGCETTTDA
jgi:hypothetical protein